MLVYNPYNIHYWLVLNLNATCIQRFTSNVKKERHLKSSSTFWQSSIACKMFLTTRSSQTKDNCFTIKLKNTVNTTNLCCKTKTQNCTTSPHLLIFSGTILEHVITATSYKPTKDISYKLLSHSEAPTSLYNKSFLGVTKS